MYLLNSKSVLDCETEEEVEIHNQEITNIFEKLYSLENYDCAVLCKYQDNAHKNLKMRVESIKLHDIEEVYQWGDFKNGVDLSIDDEYLVLVAYGQSYQIRGEENWHIVVEAFKILPYDDNRSFLNVVDYVKNGWDVIEAINQFDKTNIRIMN